VETVVESLQAGGKGEVVVDLARPAPLEFSARGDVSFDAKVTQAERKEPIADLRFEANFEARLRRE
jgi:hypothetical protein